MLKNHVRTVPVTRNSGRFVRREVGALWVTSAWFAPWLALPPHRHQRPVIGITLDGSGEETTPGYTHESLPGWVRATPPEEKHTNRCHHAGAQVLLIEPDPGMEELFRPCARLLREPHCFEDWGVTALARRVVVEITNPDDRSGIALEALALELLAHAGRDLDRSRGAAPAWLYRVRERLHDEFQNPPRLADLAESAGVHPMHMAQRFRWFTGMSIGTYLRHLRLDWCIHLLLHADISLAEIAFQAGFADQSHFTRVFRRYTGVTPGQYRAVRAPRRIA